MRICVSVYFLKKSQPEPRPVWYLFTVFEMQKVKRYVLYVGLTFFVLPFLIHHYSMNSCSMWSSNYKKSTYKLNYVGK